MRRLRALSCVLACVLASGVFDASAEHSDARSIVETVYEGFAAGDLALAISTMAPDVVCKEAEDDPYADRNPYVGPDAIVDGLFSRLAREWDGFTATPREYVVDGDRVVVLGRFAARHRGTGTAMDIPFVHAYTVEDGRIARFQQYTDTAAHVAAMTPVIDPYTEDAFYSSSGDSRILDREGRSAYWNAVAARAAAVRGRSGLLRVARTPCDHRSRAMASGVVRRSSRFPR